MTDSPVVDIVDALPNRIRVRAADLRAGDLVHDAMGGTHELVSVRTLADGRISTQRDDQRTYRGGRDHWGPEETLTIVRPECAHADVEREGGEWVCACGARWEAMAR